MYTKCNKGRRQATTRYLSKKLADNPDVYYTDVARNPDRQAHVAVVVGSEGTAISAATVRSTDNRCRAEIAIALAATSSKKHTITVITDSQQACRHYLSGRISLHALTLLQHARTLPTIRIVLTTGHGFLPGNGVGIPNGGRRHTSNRLRQPLS
ncbi:hypothetical protein HPB48_019106 [Haemaphysalis longicornis]|uniref:Uncharacterized protein n=1 Tax=Haemaphysalis longicornis TaxID=44386 RepID=A0A9J6GBM9_HAELO|nr:hypothetical protein HPB48_019106 [Haemaphysalis longicornis]